MMKDAQEQQRLNIRPLKRFTRSSWQITVIVQLNLTRRNPPYNENKPEKSNFPLQRRFPISLSSSSSSCATAVVIIIPFTIVHWLRIVKLYFSSFYPSQGSTTNNILCNAVNQTASAMAPAVNDGICLIAAAGLLLFNFRRSRGSEKAPRCRRLVLWAFMFIYISVEYH